MLTKGITELSNKAQSINFLSCWYLSTKMTHLLNFSCFQDRQQTKVKGSYVIFSFSMLLVLNLSGRLDGNPFSQTGLVSLITDMGLTSLTLFKTKVLYLSNEYLGSEESKLSNSKFLFKKWRICTNWWILVAVDYVNSH